jgi:AcrR family transcriptional regulator
MAKEVKRRAYDSSSRKAAALETRRSIIEAARRLFLERDYAGTTMQAIAEATGVALDTVYATGVMQDRVGAPST